MRSTTGHKRRRIDTDDTVAFEMVLGALRCGRCRRPLTFELTRRGIRRAYVCGPGIGPREIGTHHAEQSWSRRRATVEYSDSGVPRERDNKSSQVCSPQGLS